VVAWHVPRSRVRTRARDACTGAITRAKEHGPVAVGRVGEACAELFFSDVCAVWGG